MADAKDLVMSRQESHSVRLGKIEVRGLTADGHVRVVYPEFDDLVTAAVDKDQTNSGIHESGICTGPESVRFPRNQVRTSSSGPITVLGRTWACGRWYVVKTV